MSYWSSSLSLGAGYESFDVERGGSAALCWHSSPSHLGTTSVDLDLDLLHFLRGSSFDLGTFIAIGR